MSDSRNVGPRVGDACFESCACARQRPAVSRSPPSCPSPNRAPSGSFARGRQLTAGNFLFAGQLIENRHASIWAAGTSDHAGVRTGNPRLRLARRSGRGGRCRGARPGPGLGLGLGQPLWRRPWPGLDPRTDRAAPDPLDQPRHFPVARTVARRTRPMPSSARWRNRPRSSGAAGTATTPGLPRFEALTGLMLCRPVAGGHGGATRCPGGSGAGPGMPVSGG